MLQHPSVKPLGPISTFASIGMFDLGFFVFNFKNKYLFILFQQSFTYGNKRKPSTNRTKAFFQLKKMKKLP
jgi:hypothetical protein